MLLYFCMKFCKLSPRLSKGDLYTSYYDGLQTVAGPHLNKVFLFHLCGLVFLGNLINVLKDSMLIFPLETEM